MKKTKLEEVIDEATAKIRNYLIATKTMIECGVIVIQTLNRLKEVLVKPDPTQENQEEEYDNQ